MISEVTRIILRFVGLVALQVLILDNIEISGFVNPYFYILFLALLPVEAPGWLVLLQAFVLGLTIDMFSHTPGMHASACVFTGFMRKFLLKFMEPRDGYSNIVTPSLQVMGLRWFLVYASILILIHHFFFFFAESFRFEGFFHTLLRIALSFLVTLTLVVFSQYFIFRLRDK